MGFFKSKYEKELDGIIADININMNNNYKDNAQAGLRRFDERLEEMLIAMRQEARSNKDYAQADALRNKLSEIGIVLEDTPQGVRWKKQ